MARRILPLMLRLVWSVPYEPDIHVAGTSLTPFVRGLPSPEQDRPAVLLRLSAHPTYLLGLKGMEIDECAVSGSPGDWGQRLLN